MDCDYSRALVHSTRILRQISAVQSGKEAYDVDRVGNRVVDWNLDDTISERRFLMPKTGLKGMKSTEGRKGKKIPPGRDSLASVRAGGPRAKRKTVRQTINSFPSMKNNVGAH